MTRDDQKLTAKAIPKRHALAIPATVSAQALAPLVEGLRRAGLNPVSFLCDCGIDASVMTGLNQRVPLERVLGIWTKAATAAGDPLFGLQAVSCTEQHTFGLVSYLAKVSATWGEALERVCRYFRLIADVGQYELSSVGSLAMLLFRPGAPHPSPELLDFVLGVPFGFGLRGVEGFCVSEVLLPYAIPAHSDAIESFFSAPVRFSSGSTALVFSADFLKAPLKAAELPLAALLENVAAEKVASFQPSVDPLAQFRQFLRDAVRAGNASLASVARRMGVGPRSMQRQLRTAGSGFASELNGARHELSLVLIRQPELTLQQIAFLLGFSEPAAFHRAFRRWTGESPGRYRVQAPHLEAPNPTASQGAPEESAAPRMAETALE